MTGLFFVVRTSNNEYVRRHLQHFFPSPQRAIIFNEKVEGFLDGWQAAFFCLSPTLPCQPSLIANRQSWGTG